MQIVEQAIDRSKSHNEIVSIDSIAMRQAAVSAGAVCAELFSECDGETKTETRHEFWGSDIDGNEWRVHVALEAELPADKVAS